MRTAPALPEGADVTQFGMQSVPLREIGGIVLGSLAGDPRSLDPLQSELEPGLHYHGIPDARIAARGSYPTHGNWKLVIENFVECYHCFPSHPEYCSVMKHVDVFARESPDGGAAWQRKVDEWLLNEADPDPLLDPLDSSLLSGRSHRPFRARPSAADARLNRRMASRRTAHGPTSAIRRRREQLPI